MDLQNRGYLTTEKSNDKSSDLDTLSTIELVSLFTKEDLLPQIAVSNSMSQIAKAIDYIYPRLKQKGRLFYIGAGTSGRLGVLDAAECPPTFCTSPELVQAIIAGGNKSLTNSSEGLEDEDKLSIIDLKKRNFSSIDSLVGISAGGTTPYVISAIKYANSLKALTIAISSVPYLQAPIPADIHIPLITGPELLTGSTRLKAGTATKMALNIISTSVMIKLGKVYKNRMVDVSSTNSKLVDRSIRILTDLAEIDRTKATELLAQANGSTKLALLMALTGNGLEVSKEILKSNDQDLRSCLQKPQS